MRTKGEANCDVTTTRWRSPVQRMVGIMPAEAAAHSEGLDPSVCRFQSRANSCRGNKRRENKSGQTTFGFEVNMLTICLSEIVDLQP